MTIINKYLTLLGICVKIVNCLINYLTFYFLSVNLMQNLYFLNEDNVKNQKKYEKSK